LALTLLIKSGGRTNWKTALVLVICLVMSAPSDSSGDVTDVLDLLKKDSRYVFENTLSLDRYGYIVPAAYAALVASLAANKREVHRGMKILLPGESDGALGKIEFLGDSGVAAGIGALFIVGGLEANSMREVDTGVMILESYLFTGFLTVLGQFILAEERPRNGGEMHYFSSDGHGVSGHAALAASLVCPITHQYLGEDPSDSKTRAAVKEISKAVIWSLPLMTGISRLERDEHYLWNIVLGLTIGYTMGHMIARSHEETRKDNLESTNTFNSGLNWGPCSVSYLF
jgi:hypothetical protein